MADKNATIIESKTKTEEVPQNKDKKVKQEVADKPKMNGTAHKKED
jgi:hypothetical protein